MRPRFSLKKKRFHHVEQNGEEGHIIVMKCRTNRACASCYQRVGVWARYTQDLSNMEVLIDG